MSDERLSVVERKYNDVFKPLYENGKYSAALELLQSNPQIQSLLSDEEKEGMKGYEVKKLTGLFAKIDNKKFSVLEGGIE